MIYSEAFPATIKGRAAQITVVHNDGFCWGRLVYEDGTEFDVSTKRDHYYSEGFIAAEAFERAARRGNVSEPISSWRIGWRS